MTDRRQRACLMALAVVLVLARSFPAIYYEGFYFDSDQAIVGLMARHLSRLQTLPLFYYSLNYILSCRLGSSRRSSPSDDRRWAWRACPCSS